MRSLSFYRFFLLVWPTLNRAIIPLEPDKVKGIIVFLKILDLNQNFVYIVQ
jgi:hypothetical protein